MLIKPRYKHERKVTTNKPRLLRLSEIFAKSYGDFSNSGRRARQYAITGLLNNLTELEKAKCSLETYCSELNVELTNISEEKRYYNKRFEMFRDAW